MRSITGDTGNDHDSDDRAYQGIFHVCSLPLKSVSLEAQRIECFVNAGDVVIPRIAKSDSWFLSRISVHSMGCGNSRVAPTVIFYDRWYYAERNPNSACRKSSAA